MINCDVTYTVGVKALNNEGLLWRQFRLTTLSMD